MSNWVEKSSARSFILYTVFIVGVTWGVFTHFFDDNKVNGYRSQAENEKAAAGQYKAKTEVLEVEISRLRDENKKYLDWLFATPSSIPFLENKLKALTEENTTLKIELTSADTSASDNPFGIPDLKSTPYVATKTLSLGEAYIDQKTNATIGIGTITPDFTANGNITLPGQNQKELDSIKAGDNWMFVYGDKQFKLSVVKIDWFSNKSEVMVKEIQEQK